MTSPFARKLLVLNFIAAALLTPCAAWAQAITTPAEYAIIMDHGTGAVLYEKNADAPTAPASMSKLMTVAIVFEKLKSGELNLDDEFQVSEKAWRMAGSKMWVRVDTKIKLHDLLRGVIVQSGNDACIVIAENIAGTEEAFADLMTRKAREWGMNDSTFANATGWPDPGQMMSMRDLALLSRKMISQYPEYYKMFAEREFTWEKIRQPNRNPLFDTFDGSDGLKTGHTEESGYGLVGSAVQNGARRIVVVNGLGSEKERAQESARLMRIAFNDFIDKTLYKPGDIVGDALVFKGSAPSAPLIVREPVTMILHRRAADSVKATVVYEGPVPAPVSENQQIGYLRIETDGDMREFPLFAGKAVKEVGFLGKIGLAAKTLLSVPSKEAPQPVAQ
ncbi:MAG: D-alanyl-D-alanine carboxypeptidase family protein [Amphiplicatus sp.]